MKRIVAALLTAALLLSSSPALAGKHFQDGSGESIVFDLALVRPGSIAWTAAGCAVFVVALPFTCWSKKRMAKVGNALVATPAKYTFTRPLGEDFQSYSTNHSAE